MDWHILQNGLYIVQRCISLIGILIIISGALYGLYEYCNYVITGAVRHKADKINHIRLNLGRTLILGLEFIVAADLIGTITAPDYYEVGLLAIIVLIRTLLTFSINREIMMIKKE